MAEGLAAVFRPQVGEIAVYFQDERRSGHMTLSVSEARQLHATLSQALRLADHVADPVGAVPDGPSIAMQKAEA